MEQQWSEKGKYNCPKKGNTIVRKREFQLSENGTTIVRKMELKLPTPQSLIGSDAKILTLLQSTITYMGRLTEVNCN